MTTEDWNACVSIVLRVLRMNGYLTPEQVEEAKPLFKEKKA